MRLVAPGSTTLLLCLLLALIILMLVHVTGRYFDRLSVVSDEKEGQRADRVEAPPRNLLSFLSLSKWTWDWRSWEGLPHWQLSLPVSLSVVDNEKIGSGVGKGTTGLSGELVKFNWQRPRPEFDAPPFALYESQVPLSMAKIIMSRHTVRRPNLTRPRPAVVQPPARRLPSMV